MTLNDAVVAVVNGWRKQMGWTVPQLAARTEGFSRRSNTLGSLTNANPVKSARPKMTVTALDDIASAFGVEAWELLRSAARLRDTELPQDFPGVTRHPSSGVERRSSDRTVTLDHLSDEARGEFERAANRLGLSGDKWDVKSDAVKPPNHG